ncbi:MAG: HD domain-containing protein, partial [Candidatus Thorarchaeota archaeon]
REITMSKFDWLKSIVLGSTEITAVREWGEAQASAERPLYDYRGDHVGLVTATALHLARREGADEDIVMMAGWLHDIAKPGLGGSDDHGAEGAKRAAEILREAGVDEERISAVQYAIRSHVGLVRDSPLDTLEAQVLWEADKLVKLGVVGLLHFVLNGIRLQPGMTLSDIAARVRDYLPLAAKIAGSMQTKTARAMAQERLAELKRISESLDRELSVLKEVR